MAKAMIEMSFNRLCVFLKLLRLQPFDASTDYGRSKERYRLIALSGASNLGAKMVASLLGLVTVPLTLNYLGKQQFGLWMVVSSLVVWMQLADFGVSNGLANALAEAHGQDNRMAAKGYVSTALGFSLAIAAICILPMLFAAWNIPWGRVLNLREPGMEKIAALSFFVAGGLFIINIPLSIISRIYTAYQLGYIPNVLQIISSLASLVAILIAIWLNLSLPVLVLLAGFGPIMSNFLSWLFLKRKLPWCTFDHSHISRTAFRRVMQSSLPLFVFQIGSLAVNNLINPVLAQLSSLDVVADFNILLKINSLIFFVAVSLSTPFFPAIREAFENREKGWVSKAICRAMIIRVGIILALSAPLSFFGNQLIRLWIGHDLGSVFGQIGWSLFVACIVLAGASSGISEILLFLDYIWVQNILVFITAVITLGGMFATIKMLGLGSVYFSMGISTLLPIIFLTIVLHRKVRSLSEG
jgi:O-antigen/teichoic acid export membrane protein